MISPQDTCRTIMGCIQVPCSPDCTEPGCKGAASYFFGSMNDCGGLAVAVASTPLQSLSLPAAAAAVHAAAASHYADAHRPLCHAAGKQQWDVYFTECLMKHGSQHKYMAFIDNDEVRAWL